MHKERQIKMVLAKQRGCGSKRLASSNKDAFLKIALSIFMKRGLIAKEVAWGNTMNKVVAQNVQL
ncbi:hypothetical protein [Enterococcus sp. DIV0179]|uniref:hypothetical protein n=1 Tax=Enterococcus sp. DIV0179 TaxID=2774767 RepID=UPI003D2FB09B